MEEKEIKEEVETIEEVETKDVSSEESEEIDEDEAADFEFLNDPLTLTVEENRKKFEKEYKKYRLINLLIIIVCLIVCMGSLAIIVSVPLLGIPAMALAVGLSYFGAKKCNKKMDKISKDYISDYYKRCAEYVFGNDLNYRDIATSPDDKIKKEDFAQAGFVTNVVKAGSRNIVTGEVDSYPFQVADCAARVFNNNVEETAFLGRYFMIQRRGTFEGKTLIYVAPEKNDGCGPNDLEGLSEIKGLKLGNRFTVWSDNKNINKLFTANVIKALNEFVPNKILEDVCICLKSNAIYVALSYGDEPMKLPLQDAFKMRFLDQYRQDCNHLGNFIKALRKELEAEPKAK
ncbi:MAG: DUF3137 domain-containing protein [Bacilli bacterium]|nr:DUF3137 domain-containing protein [Bacilli bacterium]